LAAHLGGVGNHDDDDDNDDDDDDDDDEDVNDDDDDDDDDEHDDDDDDDDDPSSAPHPTAPTLTQTISPTHSSSVGISMIGGLQTRQPFSMSKPIG
jgi:hypothetical protein